MEPTALPDPRAGQRPAPARQRFALPPRAYRLARARRRVRDYLTLYCADRRIVDDMLLCVGEACTNVILHAGAVEEIEIFLGFRGDDLEILIKDKGRGFDTRAFDYRALPDLRAENGRGLFLMSRLTDEMELRRDCGTEVRLLKRAVLAAPAPADELDHAISAALRATIVERRREATERDELRDALTDSERRFAALFEGMAEGVALHELVWAEGHPSDYRIVEVNAAFERLTGLTADEVRGRLAGDLYGMAAPFLEQYAAVATGGEPVVIGAYFAPTERHVLITAVSPGAGTFATIIEDVTEQRLAEEERARAEGERLRAEEERLRAEEARRLAEEARRLAEDEQRLAEEQRSRSEEAQTAALAAQPEPAPAKEHNGGGRAASEELAERIALAQVLSAINRTLLASADSDAFLQGALEAGVRALAADAGAIELRAQDDWVVHCQYGLAAADVGRRLSRGEAPNATRATSYRAPFATADMQATATDVGLAATHALRAVLAVPLFGHEVVSGCLLFYGKDVRVFSDAEIDFGGALGAAVSLALENVRLHEEGQQLDDAAE